MQLTTGNMHRAVQTVLEPESGSCTAALVGVMNAAQQIAGRNSNILWRQRVMPKFQVVSEYQPSGEPHKSRAFAGAP